MKRLILLAVVAAGCTEPVDAAGIYSMSVAFRVNGCALNQWTENQTASNIRSEFIQSGDGLTADFQDIFSRGWLDYQTGQHVFGGRVSGHDLLLDLHGTRSWTTGNCIWVLDARIDATLDGDVLTGRVDYIGIGNGQTACAGIDGCLSIQDINGTRPPT